MKPKKSSFQRLFPDTKVAAYYDPLSQIINLSKYNADEYKDLNLQDYDSANIEKRCLLEHELTHWFDHVSTLWGQKNIVLIYNALNARSGGDIEEFWRMKLLLRNFNSDIYFDYFTEEYDHPGNPKSPWRYQISSGIRFLEDGTPGHTKPILFTRFNCGDDIPLIRVPISVASILESNAIYAEFFLKVAMAKNIVDIVEKTITIRKIEKDWLDILYNKDFALYTVIAHLTANMNNQIDVAETYSTSSSIGTLVLNLPDEVFPQMKIKEIGNDIWDRKAFEFRDIRDKGYAYYNLLKNLITDKGQNSFSLDQILNSSDLPKKEDLEDMVVAEMNNNKSLLIDGPFKEMALSIIEKGTEIFKIRGIDGKKRDFREKLADVIFLPKLMFGDTMFDDSNFDIIKVLKKLENGENLSFEEHYFCFDYYDEKINEFAKVCGV